MILVGSAFVCTRWTASTISTDLPPNQDARMHLNPPHPPHNQTRQVRDAALKKAKAADEAREAVEAERDGLKAAAASLEREVALTKQVRGGRADVMVGGGWGLFGFVVCW
jgi:hypothetical protein